jgi:hypothetical protein
MGIRSFLYQAFENYDKPDELEFKAFIDAALGSTTFTNRTVIPTSNILDDLNAEVFDIVVRQVYIIEYGAYVYFLFGIEGVYGLNGITIEQENIAYLYKSPSNALENELTADLTVGGIDEGDVFPAGTLFEDMWIDLLTKATISNLRYEANDLEEFIEVGLPLNITKFLWDTKPTPEDLELWDDKGQYYAQVTGDQISVNESYTLNDFGSVLWSLNGSNVDLITKETWWVFKTWYGTNTDGLVPTEAQIKAGMCTLILTATEISIDINTTVNDFGWIAVEDSQTGRNYVEWFVDQLNRSVIGPIEFIRNAGGVTVDGVAYTVYIYNYPTEVATIKLF